MFQKKRTTRYRLWLLVVFVCIFATISYNYSSVTSSDFDVSQYNTTTHPYIALIIDDRATQKLVTVVLNVLQHIPNDWKVQIFTHNKNWPFYQQSALSPFINNSRVFMTPIDFPRNNM